MSQDSAALGLNPAEEAFFQRVLSSDGTPGQAAPLDKSLPSPRAAGPAGRLSQPQNDSPNQSQSSQAAELPPGAARARSAPVQRKRASFAGVAQSSTHLEAPEKDHTAGFKARHADAEPARQPQPEHRSLGMPSCLQDDQFQDVSPELRETLEIRLADIAVRSAGLPIHVCPGNKPGNKPA